MNTTEPITLDHETLCEIGERWLRTRMNCWVVIAATQKRGKGEEPDRLGFSRTMNCSVLIEAKASPEDFTADQRKPWRQDPQYGMGRRRVYIAPMGMIHFSNLPQGWLLLEVNDFGEIVKEIDGKAFGFVQHINAKSAEIRLLVHEIERLQYLTAEPSVRRPQQTRPGECAWLAQVAEYVRKVGKVKLSTAAKETGHGYIKEIDAVNALRKKAKGGLVVGCELLVENEVTYIVEGKSDE